MDVFISWSGKRSGVAAEALRDWLPKVINALKPWLSAADIDKGVRWGTEIAGKLQGCKAGIICLTPENLHSDWILFEAGALSKTIENTYVCPFLIGLEPSDVEPPLAQFQATRSTKDEVLKLLQTLNSALGESALTSSHIDEVFEVWWPRLAAKLDNLPSDDNGGKATKTERDVPDILAEILAIVRNLNRSGVGTGVDPETNHGESRREMLVERAILSSVPNANMLSVGRKPGAITCTVNTGRGSYGFVVPNSVPLFSVENYVRTVLEGMMNEDLPQSPDSKSEN